MKVVRKGRQDVPTERVDCPKCLAQLEIEPSDVLGTNTITILGPSLRYSIVCPECGQTVMLIGLGLSTRFKYWAGMQQS